MYHKTHWKRLNRKRVFTSKYASVYQDVVLLPGQQKIEDYVVVKLFDVVTIVATNKNGDLICLREYKYPLDKTILTLPAGHIENGEDPICAARRELTEETGFGGGTFTVIGTLYEYPTKNLHKMIVVRATNVSIVAERKHEKTEFITKILCIPKTKINIPRTYKQFVTSSSLASITLAGLI
jgi:ADP-ribose pyrophosphatase